MIDNILQSEWRLITQWKKGVFRLSTESKHHIRTACYCRVSSEEEELVNSLENQVHYYTNYVENRPELKLVGLYIDKGKSGKSKDKRAGFLRMLRHCEEGRIDLIITKSVSRFARNTADFLEVVKDLKEKGIEIFFEKEKLYTSSTNSIFILSTLAAVAQEEISNMSQSELWAKEKRASQGNPLFKRILGYDVERVDNEYKITINEEEAAIVREVFMFAYDGVSLTHIARHLMEKEYKNSKGTTDWTYSKVKILVQNIRYTGNVLSNQMIKTDYLSHRAIRNNGERNLYLIENHHPAIISQKMFDEVQKRIVKQTVKQRVKQPPNPLSGRVFCKLCGSRCYCTVDKKRSWICKQIKDNPHLCEAIPIREHEIEEVMRKAMKKRYDFSEPSVYLKVKRELQQTNDKHFEYHRLSLFYKLEAARKGELYAATDKALKQEQKNREAIQKEILEKETLWQRIEEDRTYQNQVIALIDNREELNPDHLSIELMRAFILKVSVRPSFRFTFTWFDGTETTVRAQNFSGEDRKLKKEKMKEEISMSLVLPDTKRMTPVPIKEHRPERKMTHVISGTRTLPVKQITKTIDKSPIFLEKTPKSKTKKRVCGYARVSTGDADQLQSFQFQIVHYTYFIHKNPEWEFSGIYADQATSGTSTARRTNFNKMIADCVAGKIDKIITKSISRFSRNTLDCIKYVRMLKTLPNPVEIYFEKENIRTFDEKSELLLTILSTLAQEESRNISENSKWGTRKLIERGIFNVPGHRFYGYDTGENGEWIINEEQANVIRRIFDEYLSGKSHKAIAKGLTEDDILTPSGQQSWNTTTVEYILRNEKSLGNILFQKSYVKDYLSQKPIRNQEELPRYLIEGHHPAIIEPDIFEAAQREKERRKGESNAKKHDNQDAFFQTFYCAKCGNLILHASNSVKQANGKKKVYHYWRCQVAKGYNFSAKCDAKSYREEIFEKTFMGMLHEMKGHPQLIFEAKHAIQEVGLSEEERVRMEQLREDLKQHYHELYKNVEANQESDDFDINSTEIKNMTDTIIVIEKELEGYNERVEKAKQMQDDLEWLLGELANLKKYNVRRRKATFRDDIFRRLIRRGEVHEDGRIVYDLCLGIKWTAYGNEKRLPKAKDSNAKK